MIIRFFADYTGYYDEMVDLLTKLQTLVPAAKVELSAMIDSVECQKDSIIREDKSAALECLKGLVPRSVAGILT